MTVAPFGIVTPPIVTSSLVYSGFVDYIEPL